MTHEPLDMVLDRGGAKLNELDGVATLTYPGLDELPGVRALTTLRGPRTSAESSTGLLDDMAPWLANALGAPEAAFVAGRQVHKDRHAIITGKDAPGPRALRRFNGTDALVTDQPNVCLVVLTADCLPVFIADPAARVIALVHAGKAGTRKRIVAQTLGAFFDATGALPERTIALIGPSIGDGCYPECLWADNLAQLEEAGIATIIQPGLCTRCNLDHFYSYHAEKGFTGRMLSAIILTET